MNWFADAYQRALFPRRDDARGAAPDAFEVAVGAGWYRLVCAVEGLVDALGNAARRLRARPQPRSGTTPVGCG